MQKRITVIVAAALLLGITAFALRAEERPSVPGAASGTRGRRIALCRVPLVFPSSEKAVFRNDKLWHNGATLKVRFRDGDEETRRRVAEIAKQWTQYANLDFEFHSADELPEDQADIRLSFMGEGYWSAIGTGCSNRRFAPLYSLSLYHLWEEPPDEFRKHVLHEFGHALGLLHEHQSPVVQIQWNKETVYGTMGGAPNFLTRQQVDKNFFRVFSDSYTNYTQFDPGSIMLYYFPPDFTADGTGTRNNTVLSETDKAAIAKMYPGRV